MPKRGFPERFSRCPNSPLRQNRTQANFSTFFQPRHFVHMWETGRLLNLLTVGLLMKPGLNVIGPQVKKWRTRKGWSQETLARKLQLHGWSITRNSLAKLELSLRRVPDCEILFLARTLGVGFGNLFPKNVAMKKLGPAFQSGRRLALFPARGER